MFYKVLLVVVLAVTSSYSKELPPKTLGFYCLLADDTVPGYESNVTWQPSLYNYQINGANVLWLTFINPTSMVVPISYQNLAKCRGQPGCPTNDQLIIASIGGAAYSSENTYWPWLESEESAEAMADEVVKWTDQFGFDGIDIDFEGPAGNDRTFSNNILRFAERIKTRNPDFIVTLPVYGYPQVKAENEIVNSAWTADGTSRGIINSIGIMVYNGTSSLQWVPDYSNGTTAGGPINVNVPMESIIAGIQGTATSDVIMELAQDIMKERLGGIMVWFASVYDETNKKHAFAYGNSSDATYTMNVTGKAWVDALNLFNG